MKKFYVEIEVTVRKDVVVAANDESELDGLILDNFYVVAHASGPVLLVDGPGTTQTKILSSREL